MDQGKKHIKFFKLLLKILMTLSLLLFIFYRYIDIKTLKSAISGISYYYFFVVLLLSLIYRFILAYQLKFFFNSVTGYKFTTYRIFKIQQIATFYGLILPGDIAGGFVTWYYFAGESEKKSDSAAVIIYCRLINLVTLLPFAALGLFFEPKLRDMGLSGTIVFVFIISGLILIPFFWKRSSIFLSNLCRFIINKIPWKSFRDILQKFNDVFWTSLISCNSIGRKKIVFVIFLSVLTQLIVILSTYFLMCMVGINLGMSVAAWLIAVVIIVQLFPISIAGIGVRDISLVYLLGTIYLVAAEKAILLSTFFLIYSLIFSLLGGLYYLLYKKNKLVENNTE